MLVPDELYDNETFMKFYANLLYGVPVSSAEEKALKWLCRIVEDSTNESIASLMTKISERKKKTACSMP